MDRSSLVMAAASALAVVLIATSPCFAEPAAVEDLAWLAGCWGGERGGRVTEECWMAPGGGVMLGLNRSVSAAGRSSFEYLRIARDGDEIFYYASPGGRTPPTSFRLVESGGRRVAFANPEHDFPRRILYRLDADGALHVRAEGEENGEPRVLEWVWERRGWSGEVRPAGSD